MKIDTTAKIRVLTNNKSIDCIYTAPSFNLFNDRDKKS